MVTIEIIKHRKEIECPGCKKKVSAIIFDRNIRIYVNDNDSVRTNFIMLGCSECNNLFYMKN